jgi:DNA polymerase epsilon subunit 4
MILNYRLIVACDRVSFLSQFQSPSTNSAIIMSSAEPEVSQPTEPIEASTSNVDNENQQASEANPKKTRAKPTPKVFHARKSGATRLPISKVQRIIKADKDLLPARKEAALAVAIATEEFMQRFCGSAERIAAGKRRTTVKQEDIRQLVKRVDKYMFLLGSLISLSL